MTIGEHVGRAEHVRHPVHKTVVTAPGAVPEDDRFRPVLRLDLIEFGGDGIERLIPADPFPLAGTARASPLHGV